MTESPWHTLDTAPRKDTKGKPVPIVLFLPNAWVKSDPLGRPEATAHGRVIGWWDEKLSHWVASVHPNTPAALVYPSLWAPLHDEPVLP